MKIWRDRPRTDPSSVSDLGTGLEFSYSNELISAQLCVKTPGSRTSDSARLSCRDSFAFSSTILSSIKRSRLPWFRSGLLCPVSRLDSGFVIRIRIRNSFCPGFEPKFRELVHSSIIDHHFLPLLYIGLAIEFFQILNFYCDHRLTSFCQSDLQEAGKSSSKILALEGWKNILETNI